MAARRPAEALEAAHRRRTAVMARFLRQVARVLATSPPPTWGEVGQRASDTRVGGDLLDERIVRYQQASGPVAGEQSPLPLKAFAEAGSDT